MDALLLPTTGTAYMIAEVDADPIQLNNNLGYYTNFTNLLDLTAISVPIGFQSSGVPAGASVIAPAGSDTALLNIAGALHQSLNIGPAVARHPIWPSKPGKQPNTPQWVTLAVVG